MCIRDRYSSIMVALSISIMFTLIGSEWIFQIYEDYKYITIRGILFQFISLILMFVLVRNSSDLFAYVWITVISVSYTHLDVYKRQQEDVQMYYSCPPDEVEGKNLACTHHEMTDDGVKEFADASQVFKIDYVGDEIAVEWTVNRAGKRICTKISVDSADRKETKNRLKLALYSMIEKGTGKSLPWGLSLIHI